MIQFSYMELYVKICCSSLQIVKKSSNTVGFVLLGLDLLCVCGWWWRLHTPGGSCESPPPLPPQQWTVDGPSWPGCADNTEEQHRRCVCVNWPCHPSIESVFFFFSPVLMKALKHPPACRPGWKTQQHPTALSLWSLRNKSPFKYFPATGPPVSLRAVFLFFLLNVFVKVAFVTELPFQRAGM